MLPQTKIERSVGFAPIYRRTIECEVKWKHWLDVAHEVREVGLEERVCDIK